VPEGVDEVEDVLGEGQVAVVLLGIDKPAVAPDQVEFGEASWIVVVVISSRVSSAIRMASSGA
jgi:hypothetical protein